MSLAIDVTKTATDLLDNGSCTTASFTTASNVVLFAFASGNSKKTDSTRTTTITGGGLTWSLVKREVTQAGIADIWSAQSASALTSITVTCTNNTSTAIERDSQLVVVSLTGADMTGTNGSGAVGAINSGNNAGSAPSVSVTTTRANSWVWGVGVDFSASTARTVGSGQTIVLQTADSNDAIDLWCQRQTSTTAVSGTSVTINDTAPTGDNWNMSVVEILPSQALASLTGISSLTGIASIKL